MPVLTLPFEVDTTTESQLLEDGAISKKWMLVCDARIKTATTVPVGPVVYKAPIAKDATGSTGAVFIFNDINDAVTAVVENAQPDDLTLTIASFLDAYGANVSTMRAKRPTLS
ncbi:MAG: hypothetical protein HQK63_00090 [Desulfamplus sp.]|nr:hypothetical protein [Desulfamplus sp.]